VRQRPRRRDAEFSAPRRNCGATLKPKDQRFKYLEMVLVLQSIQSDTSNMTLKIERYSDGPSTTIRLIGRMQAEHLAELEKQIVESGSKTALDLEEVNLVDVEVVRFLGRCEVQGVTLLNCSPYIRDWIGKERD
jgi:hypothetical protein